MKLKDTSRPFIDQKLQLLVEIDSDAKQLFAYEYIMGECYKTTKGLLSKVNTDLAEELENYFGISLREYGVTIINEEPLIFVEESREL